MVGQVRDVIVSIFGAIRYAIGLSLLRIWLNSFGNKELESSWRIVLNLSLFFKGRAHYSNSYREDWRNIALLKLLKILRRHGCQDVPKIQVNGAESFLIAVRDTNSDVVLVTPHSRVNIGVSMYAQMQDLAICSIGESTSDFELFGLSGLESFVPTGPNSLIASRRALKDGAVIFSCPDFWRRRKGTLYHDIYVARGTFKFAEFTKSKVFFVDCQTTSKAVIELVFFEATSGPNAEALQSEFITFAKSRSQRFSDLKAGEEAEIENLKHQFKNFCIAGIADKRG